MITGKRFLVSVILLLLMPLFLVSQERVLMPEDIVRIQNVQSANISPDGDKIVFVLQRHRTPADGPGSPFNDIWMIDRADGEPRRFTWSARNDYAPAWSPDGQWIGFLSNRDGAPQVYRIPVNGGEAEKITNTSGGVRSFQWSPDGTQIAYTSQDPVSEARQKEVQAGRDWIVVDQEHRTIRLHAIHLDTKESREVVRNTFNTWNYAWSPDGRRIAFIGTELPTIDAAYYGDLYMVDAGGGDATLFAELPGKTGPIAFSPNGRHIAIKNARGAGREPIDGGIFLVPLTTREWTSIIEDFTGTVTSFGWSEDNSIWFTAQQDTRTTLNAVDIRNYTVTQLLDIRGVIGGISIANDRNVFATTGNTPDHPGELWTGSIEERSLDRITNFNEHITGISLGEVSEVSWTRPDGLEIQGVLIKPVNYREGGRYPTVLQIHGGPEAAYLQSWHGSWSLWGQLLAGRGYAVLLPNYRGSTSRGYDFIEANMGDLMGEEWYDIVAGADHVIELGIAEPDRIGIGGWSYGGYTSAWAAATAADRFKAAIMGAGISNWISFGGMTDIPDEMALAHWDGYTWDHMEMHWERSPLKHVDGNDAPTLILFGERDDRVPPGQGWEFYRALQHFGVDTEYVLYPRAGHGISEREHQIDLLNRVVDWFDRYLK
jgi:dipeptidyl aminopeptidase/acylaminoacyl peptidase